MLFAKKKGLERINDTHAWYALQWTPASVKLCPKAVSSVHLITVPFYLSTLSLVSGHRVPDLSLSKPTPHLPWLTSDLILLSGYIGEFEIVDDRRSGKIVVNLIGRINKCGVISPRFDLALGDIERWVGNLLPARQFGHIVLTTSYGIMDHEEARRKKTGGKVIGYFY